jgi:diguanylate cyclase (GGDEF)-like protein
MSCSFVNDLSAASSARTEVEPSDRLPLDVSALLVEDAADAADWQQALIERCRVALADVVTAAGQPDDLLRRVEFYEVAIDAVRSVAARDASVLERLLCASPAGFEDIRRLEHELLVAVALEAMQKHREAVVRLSAIEGLVRDLPDLALRLMVLVSLGRLLVLVGHRSNAIRVLHDGIALAATVGALRQQAKLVGNLGFLHGDLDAGLYERYTRDAWQLGVAAGDSRIEALSLCNLGAALSSLRDFEQAEKVLHDALRRSEELGYAEIYALSQAALGGMRCTAGNIEEGLALYRASQAWFLSVNNEFQIHRQRLIIGRHLAHAARWEEARESLEDCVSGWDGERYKTMTQQAFELLSVVHENQGNLQQALAALRQAHALAEHLIEERVKEQVRLLELQVEVQQATQAVETERKQNAQLREALQEQARLRSELERQTRTDPLTGVSNRLRLQELVEHEIALGRRSTRPISVVLIDVDHFKRINDTHGHQVGDVVLVALAQRLIEAVRDHDCVARWGGEEFCIALFGAVPSLALSVGQRIVRQVAQVPIPTPVGPIHVTVSAGVALHEDHETDMSAMLSRADAAMYEAKRNGRNQAVLAPPSRPDASV